MDSGAAKLTTQLVACFMDLKEDYSVSYSFEFFKIQDLLDCKTLPLLFKPTNTLSWPEKTNNFTNKTYVSFLHSDDGDGEGLRVLYAVGGVNSFHFCNFREVRETLPNVLTHISLGGGYRMFDDHNTRMNAGKLLPLVAEIDHLIYVLSGPTNLFPPSYNASHKTFEVYNPRDMSWKLLSDLPFINNDYHSLSTGFFGHKYSHLLLGQRLFVSDMVLSSVYDIASNTWSACHLFSDCHIPPKYAPQPLPNDCGSGFPFIGEALLWKGEFILCILPDKHDPMAVYRIKKNERLEEKAIPLELRYEGPLFLYGHGSQLVDIGDDHFAFINYMNEKQKEGYQGTMNIFTFKLESDATNHNCLLVKDLNKSYSKLDEVGNTPFLYSFTC